MGNSTPTISQCTIDGNFTTASWTMGGGVFCSFSSPTIEETTIANNRSKSGAGVAIQEFSQAGFSRCTISANEAAYDAGGVGCWLDSSATFSNCTISDNSAMAEHGDGYGGGVAIRAVSAVTLNDCMLRGNQAAGPGGGVMVRDSESSLVLTNSILWNNSTESHGGGVYNLFATATMTNCNLWGNTAAYDGGGIYSLSAAYFLVVNAILWANTSDQIHADAIFVNHSDIQNGYLGTANIDTDPLFQNAANGDFHLTAGSPCIDVGNNLVLSLPDHDFEGDDRIIDGNDIPGAFVDMGADEYLPTGGGGDFDEDGDIDGFDLATLAAGYGTLYDEDTLADFARHFGR